MEKTKKHTSAAKEVAIGVSLVAIAAASAGVYFLYGAKGATKRRKQVKAWALKARGEVLERLEKLSDINEKIYHQVITEVARQYEKAKKIDSNDVKEFVGDLKHHWKDISKEITAYSKKAKRTIKKATK